VAAGWIRLDEFEMAAPVKARQEALAAAAKAMSLDPELAEAQWVSGVVKLYYERDWHAAEKALLKAIELDGTHSRFRWEYPRLILIPTGRFGECVDQVQAAIALEPVNPTLYNLLANCYIKGRQYNEAVPYLEASRKLAVGVSAVVLQGMVAAGQGHWQQALDRFEEASRMRRSTWVLGHLGYTLAKIGRTDAARKIAAEMEARGERGFRPHFDLAVVYAALGEKDMAIESLQRTFDVFSPNILWLKVDYRLDDLRGHPRFAQIVRAVGLAP
jgi:tetratricopeptide (TPR) repeat protein